MKKITVTSYYLDSIKEDFTLYREKDPKEVLDKLFLRGIKKEFLL